MGQGVKVVHRSALLGDKLVLLCLGFRHIDTTLFPFDLFWIVYMHRAASFKIMSLNVVKFTTLEFS